VYPLFYLVKMTSKAPVATHSAPSCSKERECCSFAHKTYFVLREQWVSVDIFDGIYLFKVIHLELLKQKHCGVMSLCEHYARHHVKVKSAERALVLFHSSRHRSAAENTLHSTVNIHLYQLY